MQRMNAISHELSLVSSDTCLILFIIDLLYRLYLELIDWIGIDNTGYILSKLYLSLFIKKVLDVGESKRSKYWQF